MNGRAQRRRTSRAARGAVAVLVAVCLPGCTGNADPGAGSQVVAVVNEREITVTQLRQIVGNASAPGAEAAALDALIEEELLVQDAIRNRLDRDPAVMRAIESARRRVLASAYAERLLFAKTEVNAADELDYYKANPNLFERRNVFRFTEIALDQHDLSAELRAGLDASDSVAKVMQLLQDRNVRHTAREIVAAAEDLPMERLAEFASASPGDVLIATQPGGQALLLCLAETRLSPLSLEAARPMISRYLTSMRNTRAVQDHLRVSRSSATVSVTGALSAMPE